MRTWRTEIDPARAPEYLEFARTTSLQMFRQQKGFRGVFFAGRGEERFVITLWQDADAIAALDTSKTYAQTVAAIEAAGFLRGESTVEVLELEDGFLEDNLFAIPDA